VQVRSKWAFLFLAAFAVLSGRRADAMRTPLCDVRAAITQPRVIGELSAATNAYDYVGIRIRMTVGQGTDTETTTRFVYLTDQVGSVQQIVDEGGHVVNQYDYDAFGNIRWENSKENIPNRYTFQGREWDAHAGHYYYRNRTYIPEWGCFTGPDMNLANGILGEPNGIGNYLFCNNNPQMYTDPLGLASFTPNSISYDLTSGELVDVSYPASETGPQYELNSGMVANTLTAIEIYGQVQTSLPDGEYSAAQIRAAKVALVSSVQSVFDVRSLSDTMSKIGSNKAYIKTGSSGAQYVIIKGRMMTHPNLKGVRYLTSNPLVMNVVSSLRPSIKGATVGLTIISTVAINVLESDGIIDFSIGAGVDLSLGGVGLLGGCLASKTLIGFGVASGPAGWVGLLASIGIVVTLDAVIEAYDVRGQLVIAVHDRVNSTINYRTHDGYRIGDIISGKLIQDYYLSKIRF
jgi:RHS repeat-associated protein